MKRIILLIFLVLLTTIVSAGNVDVKLLSIEPSVVTPGSLFSITFEARNTKTSSIDDVKFELIASAGLEVDSDSDIDFNKINAGEKITLSWLVKVNRFASAGFKKLELEVDEDGDTQSLFFPVQVKSLEPTLTINNVLTNPLQVAPGNNIVVSVDLKNQASFLLRNVKIKLDLTNTPFSPINGINEKTINELNAGEGANVYFELSAGPEAESGTYKVPINLEYFDEFGTKYNSQNLISLKIGSIPKLIISQDKSSLIINKKGEISINFVNNGLTKIKLLTVNIDVDNAQLISPDSVYLGDLDVDDFQTIDLELFPVSTNVITTLSFSFKDANNNNFQEKYSLPIKVYTEQEALTLGLTKKSNFLFYLIIIVFIIVVYIIYKIFRRK